MLRTPSLAVVSLLAGAGAAGAAPATPDEAQRLKGVFERYVGHPDGASSVVAVVPHGDGYTATLDVGRLFSFLDAVNVQITSGDLSAELQPQDDGKWHVAVAGLPPIGMMAPDQTLSMTIKGYTFDGVFDPALRAFLKAETATSGSTSRSVGKTATVEGSMTDNAHSTLVATPAAPGTVDAVTHVSMKDVDYKMDVVPKAGEAAAAPMSAQTIQVQIAKADTTLSVLGERSVALDDLWQFLTAHASKEKLVSSQAELKTKLKAILPLGSEASGDATLSKLTIGTSLGSFGIDTMTERYGVGGTAAKDGPFVNVAMAGLTLPAWAGALLDRRDSAEQHRHHGALWAARRDTCPDDADRRHGSLVEGAADRRAAEGVDDDARGRGREPVFRAEHDRDAHPDREVRGVGQDGGTASARHRENLGHGPRQGDRGESVRRAARNRTPAAPWSCSWAPRRRPGPRGLTAIPGRSRPSRAATSRSTARL